MSYSGIRAIQLEQERKERIRREQNRARAESLAAACDQTIAAIKDPAIQQLVARDLKKIRSELQAARTRIAGDPDRAVKDVSAIQKRLHRSIATAKTKAGQWRKEQAATQAQLQETESRLAAEREATSEAGRPILAAADDAIRKAQGLRGAGRETEALAACSHAESLIEKARKASLDERIRREVVRGLLTTLTEMGFTIDGPQLTNKDADGGIVTLTGKLPSGKLARFEVSLDGKMQFDLDGYEGRSCAKEIERVESQLQERFGIRFGPAQVTWKNPDRISKGSRDLPTGGRAMTR
ncbi:MAG: hypothetical protein H6819_02290 [Phycisphaerales bacterium]|nr:hypothetical protein [Phycisphaerales bacterium]MCB9856958.1 hypothetical protein [Phycisphaerales bacterium]MCB9861915.1 hypothetical protein [Phycisphaerales bacterium]